VIDGRPVDASRCASLRGGVVVAPLDPFVRRFADRIVTTGAPGTIVVARGDASVTFQLGSPLARSGATAIVLPIAPFVRDGEPIIPLAVTARTLGASVSYDAHAHVLYVQSAREPLARMTPFAGYAPPSAPVTFAPTSTPAPKVVVTGVPRPRRTPIVIITPTQPPANRL
jgi:hypothetical protein